MSARHENVGDILSDYVFGNVSAEQRRDVVEHLGQCGECRREVEELTLLAHAFARIPDPVTPPAGLKERVLARLEREQRAAGGYTAQSPTARPGWHGGWLAMAAALILALGGALLATTVQQRRTAATTARLADEVSELRDRLSAAETQADLALSILTAGDMRRIELAGGAGSEARAYWSATRGLLIAADRLPVPPAGRVYQVWIINRDAPMSAGLISAPGGGRGMLIVPPPSGAAPGPVTIAVTDEPPGGLPAPTGGKHLVGSL